MTQLVPQTRTVDVVDDFHGTKVPDPYRWLEDLESQEVLDWVGAHDEAARGFLEAIPARGALARRLAELYARPHRGAPWRRGGNWFQLRNDGTQELDVLYVMSSPEDEGRVLLDQNALSADATLSVLYMEVSWDGRLLAWQAVEAGSDRGSIRFRNVATGEDLDDVVEYVMYAGSFTPDSSGIYYAAFPRPAEGEYNEAYSHERLLLHRLGTPQAQDEVAFELPDEPAKLFLFARLTSDLRFLVNEVSIGTSLPVWLYVRDLDRPGSDWVRLTDGDATYRVIASEGTTLYVRTDRDAPRGRVIAIDVDDPAPEQWREVVPESEGSLAGYILPSARAGKRLVLVDQLHSEQRLRIVDLGGGHVSAVELPYPASIDIPPHLPEDDVVHLHLTGYGTPPALARLDTRTAQLELLEPVPAELDKVVAEQAFAPSTGGTQVPLMLIHRPGATPTGDVPVLMTGYGGFGMSVSPAVFHQWQVTQAWLELGGMIVSTNLRGGSEYGSEWHDAGRRGQKQNVFDDFAACARYLVDSGWTKPERIAIEGASNGGLLVGATELQHPELFGAVICEVGLLDMLRYHLFTAGAFWTVEYGRPENPDEFPWLLGYSPVHNAKPGTRYPATLVKASYNDDRVVPSHSFKFFAGLLAAQAGDAPVLLRTEMKIGHGMGKPRSMEIDDRADVLAFAAAALGVTN
jgi:prolyl oligopeptidase